MQHLEELGRKLNDLLVNLLVGSHLSSHNNQIHFRMLEGDRISYTVKNKQV